MKNKIFRMMMIVLSLSLLPAPVLANTSEPIVNSAKAVPADVQILYNRLEEIKNTDKSEMTRAEKKELRKEVRSIKSELKSKGGGVYLSVGAIIIIILLLILLL